MEIFVDESRKPICFGVNRSKAEVVMHKMH